MNKLQFLPNNTDHHDFVIKFNDTTYFCNVTGCGEALSIYDREYENAFELFVLAPPVTSIALNNDHSLTLADWAVLETALNSIHKPQPQPQAQPAFELLEEPDKANFKFRFNDQIYYASIGACGEGLYIYDHDSSDQSGLTNITIVPTEHDYRVEANDWETVKAALGAIQKQAA